MKIISFFVKKRIIVVLTGLLYIKQNSSRHNTMQRDAPNTSS